MLSLIIIPKGIKAESKVVTVYKSKVVTVYKTVALQHRLLQRSGFRQIIRN